MFARLWRIDPMLLQQELDSFALAALFRHKKRLNIFLYSGLVLADFVYCLFLAPLLHCENEVSGIVNQKLNSAYRFNYINCVERVVALEPVHMHIYRLQTHAEWLKASSCVYSTNRTRCTDRHVG